MSNHTHQNTIRKTEQFVLHTYNRAPFTLVSGHGVTVTDDQGRDYLDFGAGISVTSLGHTDPDVIAAVTAQIAELSHVSNLYYTAPQADLAEALCAGSFADKVYFANSGVETVEAAIKFARKAARVNGNPGKAEIVAFTNSFHGRTMGALALTAREKYQAPFRPLMPGVSFAPFNDRTAAEKLIGPNTCAVFVEPIQGEGGVHVADPAFLAALRAACDRYGALLVFDEIQCGLGRTGQLWAYQHTDAVPDMLTTAKALGGGLPIGATLLTDAVAAALEAGDHGSTFAGGPVVCRAAQVVLDKVSQPDFLAHVREMGRYLTDRLRDLDSPHIVDIRGQGLMVGIALDIPAAPLLSAGYEYGVLLLNAGTHVLRLLPPLTVETQHIDRLVDVLDRILSENAAV